MLTTKQRVIDDIAARARRRNPDRNVSTADIEAVHPDIVAHYHGARVKIADSHGFTRTGTVSSTVGWRPALLLMHRSNATGSWDIIGPDDRLVAVWDGRKYIDV